jgi:hypothetical protein
MIRLTHVESYTDQGKSKGFSSFCLELHLPYLILRKSRLPITHTDNKKPSAEVWDDLAFLNRGLSREKLPWCSIYAAHATVVVSGWDRSKYIAYSFLNPGPSVQEHEPDEDSAELEEEEEAGEFNDGEDADPEDPSEDEFATYGRHDFLIDNDRSWDPRVCFLRAVHNRVEVASAEHKYLIEYLWDIDTWVRFIHDGIFSCSDYSEDREALLPGHRLFVS